MTDSEELRGRSLTNWFYTILQSVLIVIFRWRVS